MTSTAAHIRNAGAHSPEWLAERDRKAAERQAELAERQAALKASDPELAAWVARKGRRRR